MARQTAKLVLDPTILRRDTARLVQALTSGGYREARDQADRTAGRIRDNTPVLTGALLSTVGVVQAQVDGTRTWGVTYGSGERYHYVQNARRKIVKKGMRGARTEFRAALGSLAAREVSKV